MAEYTDYDKIFCNVKQNFEEEARSLLTETQIQKTLDYEKQRFQTAQTEKIPIRQWMGSNSTGYSKMLLRRQQPFFPVYYLLGIFTEASCVLFLFYLVRCLLCSLLGTGNFSSAYPVSFMTVIILGCFLWKKSVTAYTCHLLAPYRHKSSREQQKTAILSKRRYFLLFSFFLTAAVITALYIIDNFLISFSGTPVTLLQSFLLYVLLLFLSGIHNVIFSSHLMPFLSVGAFRITGKSCEKADQAASHYIHLRTIRQLAVKHRTTQDLHADSSLQTELLLSTRSSLVTYRVYTVLALLILLILDILCTGQFTQTPDTGVLVLGILALFITFILIITLISCNYLLSRLQQTTHS